MQRYRIRTVVIREILEGRRLSQNALARQAGVSSGYLSQLLQGHRCPGRKIRGQILDAPSLRRHSFQDLFEPIQPHTQGAR